MTSKVHKSPAQSKVIPAKDDAAGARAFPVVAIGASAGGLEAYKELFHALPPDTGMAFVLVQHLDPSHHSLLAEILSKATRMPVDEVKSGTRLQPNRVYVIPPGAIMAIAAGAFTLTPRGKEAGQHLSVNFFMRSLAEDRKSGAIGIILSGTGADGTLGLEGIKAEGGITFAQDPATARYDGMPRSAIDSGCVDFVLPPKEIAKELHRIRHHPYVHEDERGAEEQGKELEDSVASPPRERVFTTILDHLRKASGVDFHQYKPNTIHRRALRRAMILKLDSLAEYSQYLKEHPEEGHKLYDDVLIPVTSFFRDFEAFEALKAQVFPAIVKDKGNKGAIRMWAPGCSTGEETYSLAMTLLEFLGDRASSFQVQIFGTDLNEKGIHKARTGVYRESIAEEISPERMDRFFVKVEGGYRLNKAVRDMCVFARQNLANDPPFSQMNLVACRNLLIYIQPVLQRKIIPILHYALKPTGFLILGGSESVAAFPNLFSIIDKKHKIYGKKAITSRLHYDFVQSYYPAPVNPETPGSALKLQGLVKDEFDVQAEADRLVLKHHAPAGVVINSAMEVVQFRGRTTPYLEQAPGKPSLNVLKLARNGLAVELRTLIGAAKKKRASVRKEGVSFDGNGHKRILNLSVSPLGEKGAGDKLFFLLLFEDVSPQGASAGALSHTRSKESAGDKSESKRLKREIVDAQEALRSAIESEDSLKEEFQSANEEILSANEELQSTNEELETSKEELQSANEELNTLNTELRLKNNELHDVSNDISNLLNSTRIPVVMLDRRMSIRRFTPTADKLLKLRSSDIGRSLADIRPNIEVPALEQSVAKVLETLQPEEREVRDLQGHWHSLNILPYRTQDNKIDGVVIALQDIDAIKSANIQLTKSADFFRGIMNTVVEPLLVLDSELRVVMANEPFLTTFKVSPEGTLNRFVYSLGNGQWDIPKLRTLLEQVLPKHRRVRNFAVKHEFESIGVKTMLLNAETLSTVSDAEPMILLAIEDITERAQQEAALRESEERLHATLDTLPVAVYTTDAKGRLTHFNPASVALVGRTPDLGKDEWCVTWKLFRLDGTPLPHSECPMAVALKEDRDVPSEQLIAERPDGTRSWVEVYPTRLRNAEGRTTGGVNMIVDITERRQAEMNVRESEELFRTLFNSAPMAVFVCDRNAVIQNYNQRALDLWGRKPVCGAEKHCGSVRLWLPNGELLPHDQSPVIKVLRTGVPTYNVEVSIERPDGSRVPVLVNFAALKDAKGEITGAVTTFIDISEREEAELAMARLAAIVECSDDAIIGKDLNGIIESWNFGAERLFGYTQREAIGQPITLLFPTDRLYEEPIILERIRRGEHIEHYESVRRRKDGKLLEISLTISPIVDARGKIVGASKIARDITERKLTEAALVKSEKLATAGRLAATLAHEINNPLQAVTNLVSLWRQSPGLDAEGQEYAAMAEEELNRVTHLTQQSLNFYREAVFPTAVDVADSVQKVLSLYTRRIEAKRISVTKRYAPDGTRIQSYPGEIRQVLSTLLLNAIEALPSGGAIAVHVGKSSDWNDPANRGVRISIADNGVGIPKHNTARIFEPFFTTKGENGTGLGLWVANGIINRLGGSIRVRSSVRPGKTGTCFSIFLPTRLPNK